jgi:CubicO group peptidase (beta-lactamase class C family)
MRNLLLIFLLGSVGIANAQPSFSRIEYLCDSLAEAGLREKMIPGLTLAVIQSDSMFVKSYGVSQVETGRLVDTTTLFQLGSVGKLFTAIAVLQQVEAGKLDLNADVNTYLTDFSIHSPGRPVTLFDLLTHTAGFNDRVIGYLARTESEVTPLGDHLKSFMPGSFQPPGIDINYSNYSYALAGHLVEQVTGTRFADYVREHIFLPLGMTRSTYALPDDYTALDGYASGYRTRDTFEPVRCYPRHAMPAGSALSSSGDMARLLRELMFPSGKILRDSTFQYLRSRQFADHPQLMGYTLGLEEQHHFGARGIGKGGAFTGFLSELVIFPDQQFGLFVSTNTQTDNFFEIFHRTLMKAVLPPRATEPPIYLTLPDVRDFTGTYRSERYHHESVEDLLALYQGKLELHLGADGDLTTYQNGEWQHYRPVDSLLFQNTRVPEQYLAFTRDGGGKITRLHTNINLAGFYVPASLTPVAWYDDPVMINEYYVLVLLIVFTFLFIPLFRAWVMLRRRSRPDYWSGKLVPNHYLSVGWLVAALYLVHFLGGFMYLARNVSEFYFDVPDTFRYTQLLTYSFPVAVAALVWCAVRLWRARSGKVVFRLYYTLVSIAAVIHLAFLYRWHFIGLHT